MNKLQKAHLKLMGWTEVPSYDDTAKHFEKNSWKIRVYNNTGNVYYIGFPKHDIPEEIRQTRKILQGIRCNELQTMETSKSNN